LIRQNKILTIQNQELCHKLRKERREKERIIDQVFRIVGVSITEFWEDFCEETDTIDEKSTYFQEIYHMLMNFIQENELFNIMKTLEFFIAPKNGSKKIKTFKIVNPKEEGNFMSSYTDEEVEEFINFTNIIL
jgi:hypothetical protein